MLLASLRGSARSLRKTAAHDVERVARSAPVGDLEFNNSARDACRVRVARVVHVRAQSVASSLRPAASVVDSGVSDGGKHLEDVDDLADIVVFDGRRHGLHRGVTRQFATLYHRMRQTRTPVST